MDANVKATVETAVSSLLFPGIGPLAAVLYSALKAEDSQHPLSEKERLKLVELQIKYTKEFAIARRINTSEKVTIEEYYDAKGDGKIGGKLDAAKQSGGLDISGSGQQVSKRVYTFEGVRELTQDEKSQMADFWARTSKIIDGPEGA